MIIREDYLNWLRQLQDQKIIKVITGVRRSGKSTILQLFRDDLRSRGVKKGQIQSFNFEEEQNADITDWRLLHQQIEAKLIPDSMNYIFLDEIQLVPHFERAVASLFTKENVDIYMTGSNAFLLSGELATLLTGRYISVHMLPYSFKEYCLNFPDEHDSIRLFSKYLDASSFPEVVSLQQSSPAAAEQYLIDLYNTILQKDIAGRYEIRNLTTFERVYKFTLDSIGSTVSASSIAATLEAQHLSIDHKTVIQYLEYLANCFLLYPVSRYDIRGKRILNSNDKYYSVDLGLRHALLGHPESSDLGHKLENIVYLELLRRHNGHVFIGKKDEQEVDFMVQRYDGGREYYQVAYQVNDRPVTLDRELAPLRRIRDNYPKFLLTLDPFPENFDGIPKLNVVDWLLDRPPNDLKRYLK